MSDQSISDEKTNVSQLPLEKGKKETANPNTKVGCDIHQPQQPNGSGQRTSQSDMVVYTFISTTSFFLAVRIVNFTQSHFQGFGVELKKYFLIFINFVNK